jgi:hypothetical protein
LSFGKVAQITGGLPLHQVQHLNTFLVTLACQTLVALEQTTVRTMLVAQVQTLALTTQHAEQVIIPVLLIHVAPVVTTEVRSMHVALAQITA